MICTGDGAVYYIHTKPVTAHPPNQLNKHPTKRAQAANIIIHQSFEKRSLNEKHKFFVQKVTRKRRQQEQRKSKNEMNRNELRQQQKQQREVLEIAVMNVENACLLTGNTKAERERLIVYPEALVISILRPSPLYSYQVPLRMRQCEVECEARSKSETSEVRRRGEEKNHLSWIQPWA